MAIQTWAPLNGWPLAIVAEKQGWPTYQVPGVTVALGNNGQIYVEGALNEKTLELLAEAGLELIL